MTQTLGIIKGMAHDDYHAVDAASHSRLVAVRRSLAHCRHRLDHPEQTEALTFGQAFHSYCLEEGFWDRYAVCPDVDRRTTNGKTTYEAFRNASAGKTVLDQDDSECIKRMASAIEKNPAAKRLIVQEQLDVTDAEVSGFWHDDEHAILCKLRADRIVALHGYGTVCVDLKTTTDASPDAFRRAIQRYGYAVQSGWYLHGLAKLGIPCEAFVIVAVEKSPPHGVGVYRINDDTVEQGYREARRLLARYAGAVKTGVWGGYSDQIEEIGLAAWDFDDEETV